MTALDICIGPEFEQGSQGELKAKICGNPADQAWPYPSDPAETNGLRRDPSCGLWAPPATTVIRIDQNNTSSPARTMAANEVYFGTTLSAVVTNPSPDLSMVIDMTFRFKLYIGQEDDSIDYLLGGWDKNGVGSVSYDILDSEKSGTQTVAGMVGAAMNYVERVTDLLAPGEAATYRLATGMHHLAGSAQYLSSGNYVDGIGISVVG